MSVMLLRRVVIPLATLSALVLVHASPARAATHITSNVTTNTTWTASGSPYVIDPSSGIQVTSGATLTIEPGVIVKFAGGHSARLNMNGGKLTAVGTAASPITFTSIKDDSVGGDTGGDGATTGTAGDNLGLNFANSGSNSGLTSTLSYVVLTYGGYGFSNSDTAISISGSSTPVPTVNISHATITNNSYSAIITGGLLTLSDSTVEHNGGYGVYANGNNGAATISRTSLSFDDVGFKVNKTSTSSAPASSIMNSTVTGNAHGGINLSAVSNTLPVADWP